MDKYQILTSYFGYRNFREGQEEIIEKLVSGQDVLAIMPTGAGKSLCYQVPALMMYGITIVVSPLISLMMDQVKALNEIGVHAAFINSALTEGQIAKALSYAKEGRYKLIYVAPERLESEGFMDFAVNTPISMVTVDEAHCISQWGQDFRPSYQRIVTFIQALPKRPIVAAFTATATKRVKEDILCVLGLVNPYVMVKGFDRANLYFEVQRTKKKTGRVREYIKAHEDESGIVYCATRRNVDELYTILNEDGISVTRYHAGLSSQERKQNQEDFVFDRTKIMIATNAFGMGIDKPNVRFVLHYNMPQSMENYYQEAGRAGRDGEPAECILFYSPQDVVINQFLLESKEERAEYTKEEQMLIVSQDQERLRKMTFYCTTRQCLRRYILNYFGETAPMECKNCSNCLEEFEWVDATSIAKAIVNCVKKTGQRYGINVITGTLRGENTAKLRAYRMNEYEEYGKYNEMSVRFLKDIVNTLIERGMLAITNDKYALLKLTKKSGEFLLSDETFEIAYREDEEIKGKVKGNKKISDNLNSKGMELFEQLRSLRLQVAKERGIPPYLVAADRTLYEMCVRLPFTKQEMMAVYGMGERKYEQYGERFVEHIRMFTSGKKEVLYFQGADLEFQEPSIVPSGGRKREFVLTKEMEEEIPFELELSISDFVGRLNEKRDERTMKRLTIKKVEEKLLEEHYLEWGFLDGYRKKLVSQKGREAGIFGKEKISQKGNSYEVLWCGEDGQKLIAERLKEWCKE